MVGFRFERSATRRLDKHDMLARQRSKCAECSAELKSGPMSYKRCCPLAFSSVDCGPLVLHVDPALDLSATASADFDLRAHVEVAGMLKDPLALVGRSGWTCVYVPLLSSLPPPPLLLPPPSLLLLLPSSFLQVCCPKGTWSVSTAKPSAAPTVTLASCA